MIDNPYSDLNFPSNSWPHWDLSAFADRALLTGRYTNYDKLVEIKFRHLYSAIMPLSD